MEFQILVSAGVPSPAVHLLSNHYNLTRSEYYRQLDMASKSGGHVIGFLRYAVQGFLDGLREQLRAIRQYQLDIMWGNFAHERFGNTKSASQIRRRCLVLDLSKRSAPVKFRDLVTVSPRVMEMYCGKTSITLKRDLKALQQMRLIQRTAELTIANKALLVAFLPDRADLSKIRATRQE